MDNNKKIMEELERCCAWACRRFPGDWKKAGRPAPADLIGAAWIELEADPAAGPVEAAKRALFAEAWSFSGHSVGGSKDPDESGDYSFREASDAAETGAAMHREKGERPTEEAAILESVIEAMATDRIDAAIINGIIAGFTQGEIAETLNIARATVNRRLQAMREAAQAAED